MRQEDLNPENQSEFNQPDISDSNNTEPSQSNSLNEPEREMIHQIWAGINKMQQEHQAFFRRVQALFQKWREQRDTYRDLVDFAHYRYVTFNEINQFLVHKANLKYQLAIQAGHSKRTLSFDALLEAQANMITTGTVVETLIYSRYQVKIIRSYTVQDQHLFREDTKFWLAGQKMNWADGLMSLQKLFEQDGILLHDEQRSIEGFT